MANQSKNSAFVIAIDGPAGSGKTTTAKALASLLGFIYVDTGAMYRAVAYAVKLKGIDNSDESAVCALVRDLDIKLERKDGTQATLLNGENIEPFIRTSEMSMAASSISAIPCVRDAMVEMQREVGYASNGAILEGRDIGTVVFADSPCKIYLIADAHTRAIRRQLQLREGGTEVDLAQLEKEITERDTNDASREHSPLRKADDAIEVETTNTTIDEQVAMILTLVRKRLGDLESETV
jgi:CMP/dCMP kinase